MAVADISDLEQLLPGSAQDLGRLAEMLEQLSQADGADVLDQVQRHQRLVRFHALGILDSTPGRKRKV